jgi:hypothetical protein
MFGHVLQHLHEPRERRVVFASYKRYAQWTALAVLSLVVLFVGLDNMNLSVLLPLPDQLGAEGSALRWLDRAEAIATWSLAATVEIGLVAGDMVTLTNLPGLVLL